MLASNCSCSFISLTCRVEDDETAPFGRVSCCPSYQKVIGDESASRIDEALVCAIVCELLKTCWNEQGLRDMPGIRPGDGNLLDLGMTRAPHPARWDERFNCKRLI